jgi:hypothetical protein
VPGQTDFTRDEEVAVAWCVHNMMLVERFVSAVCVYLENGLVAKSILVTWTKDVKASEMGRKVLLTSNGFEIVVENSCEPYNIAVVWYRRKKSERNEQQELLQGCCVVSGYIGCT